MDCICDPQDANIIVSEMAVEACRNHHDENLRISQVVVEVLRLAIADTRKNSSGNFRITQMVIELPGSQTFTPPANPDDESIYEA